MKGIVKQLSFVRICTLVFLSIAILCLPDCGGNNPPNTPATPSGAATGAIGEYTFWTTATDPDGDSIAIRFDWGTDSMSAWSAYVASGDTVSMTHAFPDTGIYLIRAQARDIEDAESEWSGAHTLGITERVLWSRLYGGTSNEFGYAVDVTSDNGFVVVGYSDMNGTNDVYLLITDADGNQTIERTYGTAVSDDQGYSVQKTAEGGFVIAGITSLSGNDDVYLLKTNPYGTLTWDKTFGGTSNDGGYSVHAAPGGGYVVAGFTTSFGAGSNDVYCIKTNANGDTIWTNTYGGTLADVGYGVEQTSDNGYVIVGYTYGAGGADVYLVKLDANGDATWKQSYGGSAWDKGNAVKQTGDGGYIIAAGNGDVYLIKTDANGTVVWEKTYGEQYVDEYGYGVLQTADNGFIVVGEKDPPTAESDIYIIKTDANGDVVWEMTHDGGQNDCAYAIQETADGAYIIAGTASTSVNGYDIILLKIAP